MAAPVLVRDVPDNFGSDHGSRQTALLSDGTLLVMVYSNTDNALYIYHTANRTAFTLVATITGINGHAFSIAMETAGDHFQVIYQTDSPGNYNLMWKRYAKGAGYTWTGGTAEVVIATSTNQLGAADIDCMTGAGACAVVYRGTVSGQGVIGTRARGTSGTWSASWPYSYAHSVDVGQWQDSVSVSCDHGGPSGGNQRVLVSGIVNAGTNRLWTTALSFNVTTGAYVVGSIVYMGYALTEASRGFQVQIFRKSANVWYLCVGCLVSSVYTVRIIHVVWNGTGFTLYYPPTATFSGVTTSLSNSHPAFFLSSNNKIAVWGPTGSAVNCMVLDMSTWEWTPQFTFNSVISVSGLREVKAGAQLNAGLKADVLMFDTVGEAWYYDYNQTPVAPTAGSLVPAAGATVNTDLPTLQVSVPAQQHSGYYRRARWQIANDAGFTTSVKTITETLGAGGGGVALRTKAVDLANELNQGTKYFRAYDIDPWDQLSAATASQTFIVSHPPAATGLVPTGGVGRDYAGTGIVGFDWNFTDTSPTDVQTAYQIVVEKNSDGTIVADSGKVASAVSGGNLAIPAGSKDIVLRWHVRLWDSDDVVGDYSDYSTFIVGDVPTLTVTGPAEGGVAASPTPTVTWTFVASAGRTQVQYKVRIYENTPFQAEVYNSGWLTSAAVSHPVPTPVLVNAGAYVAEVSVIDSWGLTDIDINAFTTAWAPPTTVVEAVNLATYAASGYVSITWTDAQEAAGFVEYRVYRREVGATTYDLLGTVTDASLANYTFKDWTARAGIAYEWTVVQVANVFGSPIESLYSPTAGTPTTGEYWLIHPSDDTKNIQLAQVTAENFEDEQEQETLNLIGRGRHKDYGTYYGKKGTLTAEVWDRTGKTARQARLDLETLQRENREVYLRNPFGDLWLVALGSAQIGRIAGVGAREFHTLGLTYEEVS